MIPKHVIVIGAGGIGSHFIPVASRLLQYSGFRSPMFVVDGDRYEEKNYERQLFPLVHVGQNKAVSMALSLGYNAVTPFAEYIDTADQFGGFTVRGTKEYSETDFVLVCLCVDNDATRRMVYDGLLDTSLNFIVIDMANELHTGDVIVTGRMAGEIIGPWPPEVYPNLINPGDRPPQAYCTERAPDSPQIVTANMQAAQIGAEIVRKILAGNVVPVKTTFDIVKHTMYATWE